MYFEDILMRKYECDIGEIVFEKYEKIKNENIVNPLEIITAD